MKRALTFCLALPLLLAAVPNPGHAQAAAAPPAGAPVAGQAPAGTPADLPMFPDVPKDHWAYRSVEKLYRLGILRGEGGAPRVNKTPGAKKPVKKAGA